MDVRVTDPAPRPVGRMITCTQHGTLVRVEHDDGADCPLCDAYRLLAERRMADAALVEQEARRPLPAQVPRYAVEGAAEMEGGFRSGWSAAAKALRQRIAGAVAAIRASVRE